MFLRCRIADFSGFNCARWILAFGLVASFQPSAPAGETTEASTNALPATASPTNAPEALPLNVDTNSPAKVGGELTDDFNQRLAAARFLEKTGRPEQAQPILVSLLAEKVPDTIKQAALIELGAVARQQNDLARAESIYVQFRDRWPNDPRVPEILLREGMIFRQMGMNNLALAKFYAVMTSALSLKNDQPNYYPGLVLQAQTEIAETHYLMGRYGDAAEFYARLLKLNDPALNRAQAQFRLIRSLVLTDRTEEAASQAQDFLTRYPGVPDQAEVRFYLTQTLKKMGKNSDALQQVLLLLQEEKAKKRGQPEVWAYWQQRAGNEIANQLYREGDYIRALEVYINLAQLDSAPAWQLPVKYQIGLTYERLLQPQKAVEIYQEIFKFETELSTNATPGQKAVLEMAHWRAGFLGWQDTAEASNRSLARTMTASANIATNSTPTTASIP